MNNSFPLLSIKGVDRPRIGLMKECEVELERTGETRSTRPGDAKAKAQLESKLQERLESEADFEQAKRQEELTTRLEKRIRDIQPELDQIGNKVTAEALKVRAGQLGEIEEITEDPESGSMTIKVKL